MFSLSLFNDTPRWVSLEKKKKKKEICHIINGITILWRFQHGFLPWYPPWGPLFWECPIPGRYPTLITVAFVAFVSTDGGGEKGVEGVLCVAYFRGGPLLVLKLIKMA